MRPARRGGSRRGTSVPVPHGMGVPCTTGWPLHDRRYGNGRGDPDLEDRSVAVVTDNLTYSSSYQAFERPPDYQSNYSLIPRGIRRFFSTQTAITAKPVNDTYDLFVTATLPRNFAYVLRAFMMKVVVDTVSDWGSEVELLITRGIPGQGASQQAIHMVSTLRTPATATPQRCVSGRDQAMAQFVGPMWATDPVLSVAFRMAMSNVAAAVGAAGTLQTHVEFYEYDLSQAQRYWINTPTPTIKR